jgi:hypothetical protein
MKGNETRGAEGRSAAIKKGHETKLFNKAFDQYIDPEGRQ